MKHKIVLVSMLSILLMAACTSENESSKENNSEEYRLENVYQWLDDSNLLDGEDEDVTDNYTDNYQGITEAIRIGDITIFEFDEAKYTEQFEEIPFAVTKENIGVFVSGFSSEKDGVKEVLEARQPVEGLHKGYYLSAEQQRFVESFRNEEMNSFDAFTDRYYSLDVEIQEDTFHRYLLNEQVEWEGVIVESGSKLFSSGDTEFLVYGRRDHNEEDIVNQKELLPFMFEAKSIARPFDIEHKKYEHGETLTVRGFLSERGSKEENNPWGLRDFTIVE